MDGEAITCKALPDTCKAATCRASLAAQKTNKGCLGLLSHAAAQFARASHAQDPRELQPGLQPLHMGRRALSTRGGVFLLLSACKPTVNSEGLLTSRKHKEIERTIFLK